MGEKIIFGKILCGDWSWPNDREIPSKSMQSFVSQCLEMDVDERLSAKDALEHSWFDDIRVQTDDKKTEKSKVDTTSKIVYADNVELDDQTNTDQGIVEIESVSKCSSISSE